VLGFIKDNLRQELGVIAPKIVEAVKIYPHKKAILKTQGNNLSKRWHIEYYQWHEDKKKLVRRRIYKGFEDFNNIKQRTQYGKWLVRKYNQNIPFFALTLKNTPEIENRVPIELYSIKQAFKHIIELKYPISKNRSTNLSFTSVCAKFENYCAKNNIPTHTVKKITPLIAQSYVDYMTSTRQYNPTTTLNHISTLSLLFNNMLRRDIVDSNPFNNVDKPKKIESRQNIAFTPGEVKKIKECVLKENPPLWKLLQVIYYTYLRPAEIGRLKIENILLDQAKIYVPATISKNKKDAYIEIPRPLLSVFENLNKHPKNYYVFGKNAEPSDIQLGKNWMGRMHSEILKKIKLVEKGKTLYSWKHTGVVEAYKNGVDIKAIQMQCRHHSISQTDTYLKSLGFVDNDNYRLGVKEI